MSKRKLKVLGEANERRKHADEEEAQENYTFEHEDQSDGDDVDDVSSEEEEEVQQPRKKTKVDDDHSGPVQTNKQRTLILSNTGISGHSRHLMNDLRLLLPNHKKAPKMDARSEVHLINEACELASCNNCMFFEQRHNGQLYVWLARAPNGPSAKFELSNVHTMDELKLTGNCLKGTRPLLSFDKSFEANPHMRLLKEIMAQCFGTPRHHLKSKPFVDHVLSFYSKDDAIWFRNFQIVEQEMGKKMELALNEIGPRFVMRLVRIHGGSFGGPILYENPTFEHPSMIKYAKKAQIQNSVLEKRRLDQRRREKLANLEQPLDPLDKENLFQ